MWQSRPCSSHDCGCSCYDTPHTPAACRQLRWQASASRSAVWACSRLWTALAAGPTWSSRCATSAGSVATWPTSWPQILRLSHPVSPLSVASALGSWVSTQAAGTALASDCIQLPVSLAALHLAAAFVLIEAWVSHLPAKHTVVASQLPLHQTAFSFQCALAASHLCAVSVLSV